MKERSLIPFVKLKVSGFPLQQKIERFSKYGGYKPQILTCGLGIVYALDSLKIIVVICG